MNYTATAKANDERRWATEAMHDRMDRKQERQRFYDGYFQGRGAICKAIRPPDHTQIPPLTVEAATARISSIREIADEWQYSHEGLNPAMFQEEFTRLEAFIAHNP